MVTGSTAMKPAGVSAGGRSPKKSSTGCWLMARTRVSSADLELRARDVVRNLAAGGVPVAGPAVLGPAAHQPDEPAVLDVEADRPRQLDDLDPFLADGVDLLGVGRHLVDGPAIDQRHGRGAHAARRPRAVHGGVAGAHDAHPRPDRDGAALLARCAGRSRRRSRPGHPRPAGPAASPRCAPTAMKIAAKPSARSPSSVTSTPARWP